ncbi:hypothetical protein ACSQ67_005773 [Phaseolus vulgaris]
MDSKEFSGICSLVPSLSESSLCTTGLKMYLVESKGGAIGCMFLALFFLGTWPALLTMLERRGRLPQHTYLDYSITNFFAALLIAFTFGEIGKGKPDEPNFLAQLAQLVPLLNYSTIFVPIVTGTTVNYFLDDKINKAEILFPGVGCFLIAVFLGSAVHSSNASDNKAKLNNYSNDYKEAAISSSKERDLVKSKDLERGSSSADNVEAGTAVFLIELEERRAIKASFNLATNDQWHTLEKGIPHLTVYTAFFYFSISCFVIAIILNITFLYHPVLNLPKSSLKAYLADSDGRMWALLAGLLCGFGNGLQFMGVKLQDMQQQMLFRRSSRRTYALLGSMLFMFIVAVGVLMASSGHRSSSHTAKE